MDDFDVPLIPKLVEMIAGAGAPMYSCKPSVDLFGLGDDDFIEQMQSVITVGEFYERAAGGQIICT